MKDSHKIDNFPPFFLGIGRSVAHSVRARFENWVQSGRDRPPLLRDAWRAPIGDSSAEAGVAAAGG